MLHADSFNLSDSMSALEMMDPKMDAGVLKEDVKPAGVTKPSLPLYTRMKPLSADFGTHTHTLEGFKGPNRHRSEPSQFLSLALE